MRIELRDARPDDLPFLFRVYASTRTEELAPLPWTDEQRHAFLTMQFDAQHAHYREHYAGARFQVILCQDQPAGRLYVDVWPTEIRIVDIALLPEYRGAGIGSHLLGTIFEEADRAGKPVTMHVEMHNPARRLYDRLGFRPIADRGIYLLMERRPAGDARPSSPQPNTAS